MKLTGRMLSLLTAAVMLFSASGAAAEVIGVGTISESDVITLADSAVLTRNVLMHNSAGIQAERYIEWKAGGQLTPVIAWSGRISGGATLTLDSAAARLTELGYDVAAGLNGDMFTFATGVTSGILVTEGVLRSSELGWLRAVAFQNDGQVSIGRPLLRSTFTHNGVSVVVGSINKPQASDSITLYTPDYGPTAEGYATNVILETQDELRIGKPMTATVVSTYIGSDPVTVEEGRICFSADGGSSAARLSLMKPGEVITLTVSSNDESYNDCDYILGAYRPLVENGVVTAEPDSGRAPRTAVGIKADGTAVFYTVDGRQTDYSIGLTLRELGERFRSIGCVTAVELDGGASTDMTARLPGDTFLTRLGRPSDGTLRRCPTFIMFVNSSEHTGITREFFVRPGNMTVLAGAQVDIAGNVTAMDTNYHMTALPPALSWSSSDNEVCSVSPFGVVSAIKEGKATITVRDDYSGAAGSMEFTVAGQPDSIKIVDARTGNPVTELNLNLNETVRLRAIGIINGVEVPGGRFEWFVQDTGVASVSSDGTVEAGEKFGQSTRLFAGMGDHMQWIFVTVGKAPASLADFESAASVFAATALGTGYVRENEKMNVKYGLFSGKFSYDFLSAGAGTTELAFDGSITLNDRPPYLSLWLKGDGSGNTVSLTGFDADGEIVDIPLTVMDFTDYIPFIVPSEGAVKITGLKVARNDGAAADGIFHIDQIIAAFNDEMDFAPPDAGMELRVGSGVLNVNARALASTGLPLKKSHISLTVNGEDMPFSFDESTGQITASMPMPEEGYHRITLTARGYWGAYSSVTRTFEQPTALRESSFADIEGHWSMELVEYLDRKGVFGIEPDEDGVRDFRPQDFITRADVAVYMSRALKLDETQWRNIALPYDDLDDIPESALDAVKALYGNGYMLGQRTNGRLMFGPNTPLRRAEAFAVIGRAIPQGITVSADISYLDAHEIPEYAVPFVELLAGLGIIDDAPRAHEGRVNANSDVRRGEFAKMISLVP